MIFFDFEVFKYDWLVVLADTETKDFTEIINDAAALKDFYETHNKDIWVGYNCRGYDQYILKAILLDIDPKTVNDFIIVEGRKGWEYSDTFRKILLYFFDIMTSFHSLKQLEGFMGNDIRESDVPFNIERKLSKKESLSVFKYCRHDVEQTMEVFMNRLEEFESQMGLIKAFSLPLDDVGKTKPQLSAIILGARRQKWNDEWEISIPNTLKINKYKSIVDWYKNPDNRDYNKTLEINVSGVPHVFAWGGLHGALSNYSGTGEFINIDVASFYPALMIEYGYISRNVQDPNKYREIRDMRLKLKAEKNPMQAPYKIVLNSTYGAMKDKYNALYDPRQANNVCIGGQLLLLDLIEQLEPYGKLIQSNTDGVIYEVFDMEGIKAVCSEWEQRIRMVLEFKFFTKIVQKDVNNYIIVEKNGSYKSKGAYVKRLDVLDNDLPIVNEAVVQKLINNIPAHETIQNCTDLMQFQQISKVSNKYKCAVDGNGNELKERVLRVFASRSKQDTGIFKVSLRTGKPEKIPYTPEKCRVVNANVKGSPVPRWLNIDWYINVANKRIDDFLKGAK